MIRNRIYDLFFLAFLLAVLYGVSQLLTPFTGALLAAIVCAITFYPFYAALRRRFPHQHAASLALIADIFVLIVFVTPMTLLTWAVVQESSYLGPAMKQWSITLGLWRRGEVTDTVTWMAHLQRILGRVVGMTPLQFQDNVIAYVSQTLGAISAWGSYAAHRAVFFMGDLVVMFFTLFFLLRDGNKWFGYVHDLIPMNRSDKEHLLARIHDTVVGVSRGWLLTSLIQGCTAMLAYVAVGLEGAVLLGALTAFFGLVPGVGTVGIWVPIAISLLAKGLYWRSVFILAWGALVVVGLIDLLVRPYLIGKRVELPLFALFFSLLGGAIVWGAKGIIIGPILVAITPVLFDIYRLRYLRTPEMRAKESIRSNIKIAGFLIIALNAGTVAPLRANPSEMQALLEFQKITAELSDDDEDHLEDLQQLRSVESQIATGRDKTTLAHQAYQEAVRPYGPNDPRSAAAKRSWRESRKALNQLFQLRRTLKGDIWHGNLQLHNDKVLLGIQKRTMDSNARYRVMEDRKIQKEEETFSANRKVMESIQK